jgi:hypothetical protein
MSCWSARPRTISLVSNFPSDSSDTEFPSLQCLPSVESRKKPSIKTWKLTLGIGVAFAGMLFQLPLIAITMPMEKMNSPTWKLVGNAIFWVSFTIFGQPFAALCYFYAWQAKYGSVSRIMDQAANVTAACPPAV